MYLPIYTCIQTNHTTRSELGAYLALFIHIYHIYIHTLKVDALKKTSLSLSLSLTHTHTYVQASSPSKLPAGIEVMPLFCSSRV